MSCFINPDKENQCIFLTYEGDVPPIEIMAARYEAGGLLAKKRWKRIVVDITGWQCGLTARELIRRAADLISDLPRSTWVGLVIRLEQAKPAKFVENFARMEGMSLTCFFAIENAKDWVREAALHSVGKNTFRKRPATATCGHPICSRQLGRALGQSVAVPQPTAQAGASRHAEQNNHQ